MELILIQLLLWVGLILFFWIMRNRLNQIEAEIEALGMACSTVQRPISLTQYDQPEQVFDVIGSYMDHPIYRYAVISGKKYQFESISPKGMRADMRPEQRCVMPGLVYVPCAA